MVVGSSPRRSVKCTTVFTHFLTAFSIPCLNWFLPFPGCIRGSSVQLDVMSCLPQVSLPLGTGALGQCGGGGRALLGSLYSVDIA